AISVTVLVSSGLTNAYRSVLSARGSWLINGASEWLEAPALPAIANAASASAAATTTGRRNLGAAACMCIPPHDPSGCRAWFAGGAGTVRLGSDARAGAALERVAQGGGRGDQRLVPGGPDEGDGGLDLRPHRAGGQLGH